MKAEKVLKVFAPLEAFRPGDFVRVCSPYDCDNTDTYLVVGGYHPSDSLRLVSTRDWTTKLVINATGLVRFNEVAVDLYERDKRLNNL